MDNSGCFLNTTNTSRVLGCVDPDPAVARRIFCSCWGCNGDQLVNFMPTLHCNSTSGNATWSNSSSSSSSSKGSVAAKPHGTNGHPRMPVPVLPPHHE
ncbi:hypothetical protein SPI_02019 [Niveomyces insectorum RCEF 264]|uniref:Uncharacterized protein n=1 Tax=Niveomyces insectorum RCEF 264 TaxID=1081102 RepID=A0A162J8A9_9HYPO|nr:hypothetical protein SPI_02019 [Niveomyces insectorum RCEF 264]